MTNDKRQMTPVLCIALTPAWQETRLFDAVRLGTVNRSTAVSRFPAGKGVNVAKVLRTLGGNPLLTGFIGGSTGEMCLRGIERAGIKADFVATAAPTRVCVTMIERLTGRATELVDEAPLPRPSEWRALRGKLADLVPHAAVVTLAGALMPGASPGIYREIAALAARNGVDVIVDSQREPLLAALKERPVLAKLNVHELENTLGRRIAGAGGVVKGARQLLSRGPRNVVVTHGERGAWLVAERGAWKFQPPDVPVCNPIGSGDAMTAGIAFALSSGKSMEDAIRLGVACGAANAMTPDAGTVRPGDVKRILKQVMMVAVRM